MSTRLGLLAVLLLGSACRDDGFTLLYNVDIFQQNRRNQLDLLVVIDNSCSMVEEQQNVASNFDALIDTFATAEVDWQLAVTTTDIESERFRGKLISGDDEIVLRGASGELARVEYDRRWLFEEGIALQLVPNKYAPTSAQNVTNWCQAPNDYAEGERGSPGVWNPTCDGTASTPPSEGVDEGPYAPRFGNLVISEIMANAKGPDSSCEWFELTNLTKNTLNLGGMQLRDEGNNAAVFPEGVQIGPYDVMVVGRTTDSDLNCGVPVDIAAESGFSLQNPEPVLTAETEDPDERFAEMIAQGTQGTGIEHGLEAARLALTQPVDEVDQGWLREDAALAILVVSDEDDSSALSIYDYERAFKELKGDRAFRQDGWFQVNSLVGIQPTDDPLDVSCESEDGVAYYASRYIELSARTGGLSESICADDFQPVVQNLGLQISGLDLRFTLKDFPILDTLEVGLYEEADEEALVRRLERGTDFTYDPEDNAIVFDEDQIPPAEYYIQARYRPLASGSAPDVGQDTDAGESGGEQ